MYSNEQYLLELLVEAGALDPSVPENIRAEIGPTESVIDKVVQEGLLSRDYIAQVAANSSGLEFVDLNAFEVDPGILAQVNGELARRVNFLPIGDDGLSLQVAIADPFAMETLDSLPPYQIIAKISRPMASVPKRNVRQGATLLFAKSI